MSPYDAYCKDCRYQECCNDLNLLSLIKQRHSGTISSSNNDLLVKCVFCNSWEITKRWKRGIICNFGPENTEDDYCQDLYQKMLEAIENFKIDKLKGYENDDILKKINSDVGFLLRGGSVKFDESHILSPNLFLDLFQNLDLPEIYFSDDDRETVNKHSTNYSRLRRLIVGILNERMLPDPTLFSILRQSHQIRHRISEIERDPVIYKNKAKINSIITIGIEYNQLFEEKRSIVRVFNQALILGVFSDSILRIRFIGYFEKTVMPTIESYIYVVEIIEYLKCLVIEYRRKGRIFAFISECVDDLKPVSDKSRQQKSKFNKWLEKLWKDDRRALLPCHASGYEGRLVSCPPGWLVNAIETALREQLIQFSPEELNDLR